MTAGTQFKKEGEKKQKNKDENNNNSNNKSGHGGKPAQGPKEVIRCDDDDDDSDDDDESDSGDVEGPLPLGGPTDTSGMVKAEPEPKTKTEPKTEFKKKRRPADRVQRTGDVDLNLTDNYGRKSNWGIREGVRELIQNLYLPCLNPFPSETNNSADNVRTHANGTSREVEWVFEPGEKDRVPTYIAYTKGTKPKPDAKTGLHNRKTALGYIFHRLNEKRLVLINHNTKLSRGVWSMGETTKATNEHCIGGHGMRPSLNFVDV
jgi:hypothetical protein